MSRPVKLLCALALALGVGCRSALRRSALPESEPRAPRGVGHEVEGPEATPADDEPSRGDWAPSDPYAERAGSEAASPPPSPELGFQAPGPRVAPVAARPALAGGGLAVAFVVVRDGKLAIGGQALLDFERALQDEPRVAQVTGLSLGVHDVGADQAADVEELAAVAADLERDLVVVDLRDDAGAGEVFVVHAARGELVVRLRRGAQASESASLDLYDALAFAAAALD